MLAVYQRCLANYQSRQWDIGAHVLFNVSLHEKLQADLPTPDCWLMPEGGCLSACLLQSQREGSSNAYCLNEWLRAKDVNSLDFFEYEASGGAPTHACQVFSGPAKLGGTVAAPFRLCLDSYERTAAELCKLPSIVWSGRSTNKVPVGVDHSTVIADATEKINAARNTYASIQLDVSKALDVMKSWSASNLNVMVFSAEGDMLHQFFDCYMMGAESSAEVWPGPDVVKPIWARNDKLTRDFQLPCSGEALRDRQGRRDSKSPFTCGSHARRSAIKYFLRNQITQDPTTNNQIIQDAVNELLGKLEQAWLGDLSGYMCQCSNGLQAPECCKLDPSCDPSTTKCSCPDGSPASYACCDIQCKESTFLPANFQVEFAKIKGQNMVQSLFDKAAVYLNSTVWLDNRPWLLYDMGGEDAYNWSKLELQSLVEDAMFDTTNPVVRYHVSELGYPFKTTIQEMCLGLLQQVHMTLPLRDGRPTTLANAYDPDAHSTTINMTYREDFVRKLVQEAYKHSPLFWHYPVRHRPSDSAMCKRSAPQRPVTFNVSYFVQGYNSLKVGGWEHDCYCGWWYDETHCKIPSEVCERLVLLTGTLEIQDVCAAGGIVQQPKLSGWMAKLIEMEGGWKGWPCPSMWVSDHWGIMADQTKWLKGTNDLSGTSNLILQNGTSGLRVGSFDWLRQNIVNHINPAERRESVQSLTCAISPPVSLVDHFVDDLFPAAQGVRHSASVSACLRFTIELARQSAYQEAELKVAAAEQGSVVGVWRKRCELKLKQVAFCHINGVYDIKSVSTKCPFSVDNRFEGTYTLTNNCLVIYNGKVYDPCLCDAKFCSLTSDRFPLFTVPETCAIFHVKDMVVDTGTGVPPWPTQSETAVPRPLARSSFYNKVLLNAGNVANNPGHWAMTEGETFHYCDLVVDWWPDNWKHPVGYHVTLPCTDAAPRTFDAAWAALREGSQIKMMHVPNALRNRTMQTNMYGAAGACRTHNYGMPTKVLNTMRFCTQADNRAVDPSVPGAAAPTADWGVEYCTQSPFEVPWSNGPSSVGTYFNYLVDLLPFASWGDKAGHAPFKACNADSDCCPTCKCLLSKEGGICAKMQPGTFECAQHQHCTEKMCAGDGLCVQPVLEIHNNASMDIVSRVLTNACQHEATDLWGTSKEELVPDVLESSGMCSYRSWFEHRGLKNCNSDFCTLDGNQPWMFSSSFRSPRAAFDAEIMSVKAHVCDRDYEHLDNLVSCNPGSANALLRDGEGLAKSYMQGSLTATYRPDKQLKIVRHPTTNMALGFLGMPKLYGELGYSSMSALSTTGSFLKPCSSFGLCTTQPSAGYWYVNGFNENARTVTVSSTSQRAYAIDDTMGCGSMGFKISSTTCMIDAAVVPLFYVHCKTGAAGVCSTYTGGLYPLATSKSQLQTIANNLNALFASLQLTPIDTLAHYLAAVDKATAIWNDIVGQTWRTSTPVSYPNARVDHKYRGLAPRGLYYLLSYSAYEVPFAWWWRCSWLSGIPMSASPAACPAWDGLEWTKSYAHEVFKAEATSMQSINGKEWLARANGLFSSAQIQTSRNNAHQRLIQLTSALTIPQVQFACYTEADYLRYTNDESYLAKILQTVQTGAQWPTVQRFEACNGIDQCIISKAQKVDGTKAFTQDTVDNLLTADACTAACKCTTNLLQQKCAFAQDAIAGTLTSMSIPQDQSNLPAFVVQMGTGPSLASKYDAKTDGCNVVHCCSTGYDCPSGPRRIDSSQCRCLKDKPTEMEIQLAGITPRPEVPPWLIFSSTSTKPTVSGTSYLATGTNYVAVDMCKPSLTGVRCTLGDPVTADDCVAKHDAQARQVQNTYCPPSNIFSSIDSSSEVCASKYSATQSACLGSNSIENKFVHMPTGLKMDLTVFKIPNIDCWKLTCAADSAYATYNDKLTYETTGFAGESNVEIAAFHATFSVAIGNPTVEYTGNTKKMKLGVYRWKTEDFLFTTLKQAVVDVQVSENKGEKVNLLSYNTAPCKFYPLHVANCELNAKSTRGNSKMFATLEPRRGYERKSATLYTHLTQQRLINAVQDIIRNTEDHFSDVQYSPVCLEATIDANKTYACKNKLYAIESSAQCSHEETGKMITSLALSLCKDYTNTIWFIQTFCSEKYKNFEVCSFTEADNLEKMPGDALCLARLQKGFWQEFLPQLSFKCVKTVYRGLVSDSCTRTLQSCAYSADDEIMMRQAGLPSAGFCPECVGTCPGSKSTTTYALMKNNIKIHDFVPVKLTGSTPLTPAQTKHFHVKLKSFNEDVGAPTCNSVFCGANTYNIEVYKGLFVCLPCKVVPPKYCTGNHKCSFMRWNWPSAPLQSSHTKVFSSDGNDYESVYAAARANILAMLPDKVYLQPQWHSMLDPYNFKSYNPQDLKIGYNDNMEQLETHCTTNNKLPVFTDCQNDEPRKRVRDFAYANYKIQDGSLVPAGHTLSWYVSKAQLLGTNVAAWHMAARQSYFNELFDDAMCKNGTISNLICFQDRTATPPTTLTVNPVMSGRFEVQEGCDVIEADSSRVIDSVCNAQTCPPSSTANYDIYNTFQGSDYTAQASQMRCKIRNGATAGFLSTPKSYPTNLCAKQPAYANTCELKQGMLGHKTYDGTRASSVYRRARWTNTVPSGLLSGLNPVLNMKQATVNAAGNFTLDPWDIGGHYIRMRLDDSLQVSGLPLRSYSSLAGATAVPAVDWVAQWRALQVQEGRAVDHLYVMRTCASWDCPLRRRYFWSGQGAAFRPQTPNPPRATVMYGTLTHPTTRPTAVPPGVLAPYKTRNGFCVCLDGDACQPASGACSAADTIASLSDMQYRTANTIQADCQQQVDWPWTGGTMRDDSSLPISTSNCGVLSRLPNFQYRYKDSHTILDSQQTTLDEGGDCHMGRPASYSAAAQTCTLVAKRDTEIVVNCGESNITLARPKSANVSFAGRRRCAQCDPLPTFHAADGTALPESEVSYGKLWRWAPSRKLAQDLRFRLCGNDTACPQLKSEKFQLNSFWYEMMAGGLTGTPQNTVNQLFAAVQEDPDGWTDKPWMLCTNSGSGTECQGTASKRAWLRDRAGTCSQIKDQPNANEAVADLTVCDLDESLDVLCRTIQNARHRLFEANCKLSGACRTSSFFYQPATYSATNDQLSRQTVQYFYEFAVPGSCPAMTAELEAILAQNRRTAQECSAQSLELFKMAINAAREVLHFFVRIFYYMSEIAMNIMALVMAQDPNPIIKMIMTNFTMLLNEFKQFFMTMGDLFYKMILDTGQLGKFIKDMVIKICEVLSFLIDNVIKPLTCFIKEFVVGLIGGLRSIAGVLTFGAVDLGFMDDWKRTVEEKFDCNFPNPFNCTKIFDRNNTGPSRLPMPTRCWVGYKPQVGDQRGLGCSASDTCMDDDGEFVACAACSLGFNGSRTDVNTYGCDALTKLCRCHTVPVGQTQCSSHQECTLPDVECGFVDAYLQPSFGNVPCSRCSQAPICLVSGSVGQCTCTLRATALQTCPALYHAQRVSPDPTQLCLVSLGLSASSSSSYSANYRDLASTACANLNGAQTWCLNIWLDQGGSAYMTVGLAMLRGRRLLGADTHFTNYSIQGPDWSSAHEPCRSLMAANNLGILETHVASDCERWRQVGERAILIYNLTNRTDVQFTSYLGLAEADLPVEVYMYMAQYAEWVQPASVLVRRYMHRLRPLFNRTASLLQAMETMAPVHQHIHIVKDLMPWFAATPNQTHAPAEPPPNASYNLTGPGRRLLGTWKDNLKAAKQFSVQLANGNVANLAPDLAAEWSRGPFFWPPSYSYWEEDHVCLAASIAFNLSFKMLESTVRYYTKTGPPRPVVVRTFQGALPALSAWNGSAPKSESELVGGFKGLIKSWVGVDFTAIKTYTTSPDGGTTPSPFSEDLSDLIRCDFEKVQHCTGHRRSLFWGGVVVAIYFAILSFLFKLLNVPMIDPLLMMAYVPVVTLYVFGISFMCVPMIPTCFLAEVLDLAETLLPISYQWPNELQHYPGCIDGAPQPYGALARPGTVQCLRECTEWPFEYLTWEDNVAWIQCDLGYCDPYYVETFYKPWAAVLPIPQPYYGWLQMDRYVLAINTKRAYLQIDDKRTAQRMCALFTVFNVVPVLLAFVVIAIVLLAAAALTVALANSLTGLILALVSFIHSY